MPEVNHPAYSIGTSPISAADLAHVLVGERLGVGMNRSVWSLEFNPDLVLKWENQGTEFQNVLEWRIWQDVKDTALEKWFAPCVSISPNGHWLVQKRVTFPSRAQYPIRVPGFFNDTKFMNFGRYNNRWVACDYGYLNMEVILAKAARARKAKWWGKDRDGVEDKRSV